MNRITIYSLPFSHLKKLSSVNTMHSKQKCCINCNEVRQCTQCTRRQGRLRDGYTKYLYQLFLIVLVSTILHFLKFIARIYKEKSECLNLDIFIFPSMNWANNSEMNQKRDFKRVWIHIVRNGNRDNTDDKKDDMNEVKMLISIIYVPFMACPLIIDLL